MPGSEDRPRLVAGPILYFRGVQGQRWWLSALFVLAGDTEPEDLLVTGVSLRVPPRHVSTWRDRSVWRFDFAVPRADTESVADYGFAGATTWRFAVPGLNQTPRLAFTACNGAEDLARLDRHPGGRNERWQNLARFHAVQPLHLLLQGGDQIYADGVWHAGPNLAAARRLPWGRRLKSGFNHQMAEEAVGFYFDLYCKTWSQPELAAVLAAVPSVMIWDDHDIFDGWGSHRAPAASSQLFQGLFETARRQFSVFQLGAPPREPPECVWGATVGTMTQGFKIGELGILALDLRTERTPDRILSEATWQKLPTWFGRFANCRNLLLMSSTPLVFVGLGGLESLVMRWPVPTPFEDDLRDQWRSPAHLEEWRRLIGMLSDFSNYTRCQITALSGEIHLGGAGVLRGPGLELRQLTASGVVHPPPGAGFVAMLEWLAARPCENGGINLEMPRFNGTGRRFLRARNWLSLEFDDQGLPVPLWHIEGMDQPVGWPGRDADRSS